MGLLSADYYQQLRDKKQNTSALPPAIPTATQPAGPGFVQPQVETPAKPLGEKVEDALIGTDAEFRQSAMDEVPKTGLLSEADQIKKFGGVIGSQEYYKTKSNPLTQAVPSLASAVGLPMPDQETWDKLTFSQKAGYLAKVSVSSLPRMAFKLPRQLIKAPIRLGYSVAKPWIDLASGRGTSFEQELADKPLNVPYIGEVPTYWKSYGEARSSGMSPLAATLMTGTEALGDVTMTADLASTIKTTFEPKFKGAVPTNPDGSIKIDTKPIEQAVIKADDGSTQLMKKPAGSTNEYYPASPAIAKKYGGTPENVWVKLSKAGDNEVGVSVVKSRPGIVNKVKDFVTGKGGEVYQGDFGPEIKLDSQTVKFPGGAVAPEAGVGSKVSALADGVKAADGSPIAKPMEQPFDTTTPSTPKAEFNQIDAIPPKALKGFENAPITSTQIENLTKIAKANGIEPEVQSAVMRLLHNKEMVGELTQSQYADLAQTLGSFSKASQVTKGEPFVNMASQYLSPQRYFMRQVEGRTGLKMYSDGYVPIEDAFRLRNTFREGYRTQAREIFGDYAGPKFGEERRLIKAYMEGDTGAVLNNPSLKPQVKTDLVAIADKMKPLYDKLGQIFDVPADRFLKNYQPHIQNIGGVYQLYKEGSVLPKKMQFMGDFERTGAMKAQVDDALSLFDIYTDAGSNKKFLNPALERVNAVSDTLPETLKNSLKSYVGEKLGYAGRLEKMINEITPEISKKIGVNLPPDLARQMTQVMMDTTYAASLGLRPDAVVRNSLQYFLMTYPRLGSKFMGEAMAKALSAEGIAEMKSIGFLVDQTHPHGISLARDIDTVGQAANVYKKATSAILKPYSSADVLTRGATYFQSKFIWEDALKQYAAGKLDWSGFEKAVDLDALHKVDQNIIRQRLVSGDQKGAFEHFARDIMDETQFPYRKGASARATYGLGGKLTTQFGQWNLEATHTLGRWAATKQFDKLIRWYATATALKRTAQDAFGVDITSWVGSKTINPTLAPLLQFGQTIGGVIQAQRSGNLEEYEKNKDSIVRSLKSLAIPGGAQMDRVQQFITSMNKGADQQGNYPVLSRNGKLLYRAPFSDLWWKLWGFNTNNVSEQNQLPKDINNAVFERDQAKQAAMQALQNGNTKEFNDLVSSHGLKITPNDFDAYYIPLNQRLYNGLSPALKGQFAPRIFKK